MGSERHTWDFMVVGAGSSGSTLAARLSEDANTSVLLIEAGLDYRSADTVESIRTHLMSPSLDRSSMSDYYWTGVLARRTVHQEYEFYYRGRGVGGSSAINAQVSTRPPMEEFDAWASAGCAGWAADDVLPFFVKLEDDVMFGDEPYHGRGGPIPIHREPIDNWSDLDIAFRDAAVAAGYPWSPDTNAPAASGCAYYPFNSRDHVRVSTNDAYLEPARGRPNLTIRANTIVDRVVFDGPRAVGVTILGEHGVETVAADQVILCGGVVGSAAILLRSGIGPADDLRQLGIPVVADLAVGRGVQDHANISLRFPMDPAGAQGIHRPVCCVRYSTGLAGSGLSDMFLIASGPMEPDLQIGVLMSWLNQCFSRGTLKLVSPDPRSDPIIDMRLLDDERDRIRELDALRRWVDVVRNPALERVFQDRPAASDGTTIDDIARMSDDAVMAWAARVVRDVAHLCGSCSMGDPDDAMTVVDPQCRVLGTESLRVADASIFPAVPRANPNLTAIMVGERVAGLIRARSAVGAAEVS